MDARRRSVNKNDPKKLLVQRLQIISQPISLEYTPNMLSQALTLSATTQSVYVKLAPLTRSVRIQKIFSCTSA